MTLPPFRGRDLAQQLERLALAADRPADLEAICAAEPPEIARSAPPVRAKWVLQEIQRRHGYIPERYLRHAAILLGLSRGVLYQLALGDDAFRFTPPSGRRLAVCIGPTCLSRGSAELLKAAEDAAATLNEPTPNKSASTSPESASTALSGECTSGGAGGVESNDQGEAAGRGPISVHTVRCFGMCRSAPVFQFDGRPCPQATLETLRNALQGGGGGEGGSGSAETSGSV